MSCIYLEHITCAHIVTVAISLDHAHVRKWARQIAKTITFQDAKHTINYPPPGLSTLLAHQDPYASQAQLYQC